MRARAVAAVVVAFANEALFKTLAQMTKQSLPAPVKHVAGPVIPLGIAVVGALAAGGAFMARKIRNKRRGGHTRPRAPVPQPRVDAHQIRNDRQNVHDHGVVSGIAAALRGLPQADKDAKLWVQLALCSGLVSNKAEIYAMHVLQSLNKEVHSTLAVSELEALGKVWAQINTIADETRKTNAIQTLIFQLASGVENRTIVCSTGKIARIVGALDGVVGDKPVAPPTWAVNVELNGKAASIRQTVLGEVSPEVLRRYNAGKAPETETRMRAAFF